MEEPRDSISFEHLRMVPGGQCVVSYCVDRRRFRPQKIEALGDTGDVYLCSLKVGDKQQIPDGDCNGVPLIAFHPDVLDSEIILDACGPAEYIELTLHNHSPQERECRIRIFGVHLP